MPLPELDRTARLLGIEGLQRLAAARVALFGLGGVGSWTAEALARSGVGSLTIVDADVVTLSNINRQLPALHSTVGEAKTAVMARRLADIAPQMRLTALPERYTPATPFPFEDYDVVIDAIDSLADKAALIVNVTRCKDVALVSSMGAAQRLDPTKIAVAEFRRVEGDALAAALRRRFRRDGVFPARKFRCVFSTEQRHPNFDIDTQPDSAMTFNKIATANGAFCPVTATFGMTLAAEAVKIIIENR